MAKSATDINKGVLFLLLSTIMYGSYGIWSRLIGDSMGTLYQGWTRGLLITLILIPILLYKKQLIPIERKDWTWLIVFLIFTSATQAPIFYAFNHMDIGSASLLFFAPMLLTMYVVGFVFLKEKITYIKIISFIIAALGLYSLFSFSIEKFSILAASMAVFNGIASGGEVAFSKKLTGNYSPLYVSCMSWIIIVPTNLLLSIAIGEKQLFPSLTAPWLWQLCFTFVSFIAFWFVIYGLKYIESSVAGLIGLFEVVFSILFGIILFGENLTVRIIIGAILILSASSLPHLNTLLNRRK